MQFLIQLQLISNTPFPRILRFFDPNWTRFRRVFIRDMKVNYDNIKGQVLFQLQLISNTPFPRITRFFDPNCTIFRWVFIRDMKVNYDNIKGHIISKDFKVLGF